MTVELVPGVVWINESHELNGRRKHVSTYLLKSDRGNVLVDTGSFSDRGTIQRRIDDETAGKGLDAIIISHTDYPHSANVGPFREEWPGTEIVASSGYPAIQGLPPDVRKCEVGTTREIQHRRFHFIDPPLADRSHTTWVFDESTEILFTADGFGSYHAERLEHRTAAEIAGGIGYDSILEYHRSNLVWLKYVDPPLLTASLRRILKEYHPTYVAPIHGHPIERSQLPDYLDKFEKAVREIISGHSAESSTPN